MDLCIDCQNYKNLKSKATGGGVTFEREDFVEWKRAGPERRQCVYCGIGGDQLYALDVPNPRNDKRFEVIGVDRRDNDLPYTLDNIQPCCPLCNGIKSGTLTHREMLALGPHLRELWDARLANSSGTPGASSAS